MGRLSNAAGFGKRVFEEFSEKNVTFMAASLAYNAFISLAPMLLLLFFLLSIAGGDLEQRAVEAAEGWLPGPIADVVTQMLQGDAASGGASVIGILVLLWGTLKIFRGLDTAFSEIYETTGKNSFTDKLKDGVVVFGALALAILATVGTNVLFGWLSNTIPFIGALTPLVLLAGLVLALLPMYYVFPDVDLEVREVLPGVIFAAVAWAAFQGLFQVYLAFSDPGAGSFFGGVIVVVTYLYFSGLVLLLGAVINAVIGDHATGEPGGIGQGATSYDTEREQRMSRSELAGYLWALREDLTHYYGETRSSAHDEHPDPDGDVEVVEHTSEEDGKRRYTVTLSWDVDEDWNEDPLGGVSSEAEGPPDRRSGPSAADD